MAKDQVHEKNNKIIKRLGGATSLLNPQDESALIMWETCGLEVPRIVARTEFEDSLYDQNASTKMYNLFIKQFHVILLKWLL